MGHACSQALDNVPLPTPLKGAEGGDVTDVLRDGRLLADYVLFLSQQSGDAFRADTQEVLELELWREDEDALRESSRKLSKSWEVYRTHPQGLGDFEQTQQWACHAMPGQNVVKKLNDDDPMYSFALATMLGIHVAVTCSSLTRTWAGRPLGDVEEEASICRRYQLPKEGSAYSPSHILEDDFEIEEFAPNLFSAIREASGVGDEDFFNSLCRTEFDFINFGTNSKSGELFYFTHDKKYLLKTCSPKEADFLLQMLPQLLERFRKAPHSLLGRYFGLYRVLLADETPRLFFVMRGIGGGSGLKINRTFDMKGSTTGRRSKEEDSIKKDLDFWDDPGRLDVPPGVAETLAKTHEEDCELLREYGIMDYSLLLKVHEPAGAPQAKVADDPRVEIGNAEPRGASGRWASILGGKKSKIRGRSGLSGSKPRPLPAPAAAVDPDCGVRSADGQRAYFFGIIDMLVPYDLYPQMQYGGTHIISCGKADQGSRVPPQQYADRQIRMFRKMLGLKGDEQSDCD